MKPIKLYLKTIYKLFINFKKFNILDFKEFNYKKTLFNLIIKNLKIN